MRRKKRGLTAVEIRGLALTLTFRQRQLGVGGFATKEKDREVEERIDKGRPLALLGESCRGRAVSCGGSLVWCVEKEGERLLSVEGNEMEKLEGKLA